MEKRLYDLALRWLGWWPIQLAPRRRKRSVGSPRLGYYLPAFPVLSQTFIQREIRALRRRGFHVEVAANEPQDVEMLDETALDMVRSTFYLPPRGWGAGPALLRFVLRRPLRTLNLFLFLVFHDHGRTKTFYEDRTTFERAVRLAAWAKERRLTHLHSPWALENAIIVLVASRLLDLPCSVQARAYDLHRRNRVRALPEKLGNADFVITNSDYNLAHIRTLLGPRSRVPIHRIYNGLELAPLRPPEERPERRRGLRVLCVGRLVEQKGIEHLLVACKALQEKGFEFTCDVVGPDGPWHQTHEATSIRRLHGQLDLGGTVEFVGPLPHARVVDLYRDADLFVLPCDIARDGARDILPNVVLEAMAMELPVVSTRITGIPEIVDDGVDGLLVAPGSSDQLAEAMARLFPDPELRASLGRAARRKVRQRFDIEKNIERYAELFSRTADRALPSV